MWEAGDDCDKVCCWFVAGRGKRPTHRELPQAKWSLRKKRGGGGEGKKAHETPCDFWPLTSSSNWVSVPQVDYVYPELVQSSACFCWLLPEKAFLLFDWSLLNGWLLELLKNEKSFFFFFLCLEVENGILSVSSCLRIYIYDMSWCWSRTAVNCFQVFLPEMIQDWWQVTRQGIMGRSVSVQLYWKGGGGGGKGESRAQKVLKEAMWWKELWILCGSEKPFRVDLLLGG